MRHSLFPLGALLVSCGISACSRSDAPRAAGVAAPAVSIVIATDRPEGEPESLGDGVFRPVPRPMPMPSALPRGPQGQLLLTQPIPSHGHLLQPAHAAALQPAPSGQSVVPTAAGPHGLLRLPPGMTSPCPLPHAPAAIHGPSLAAGLRPSPAVRPSAATATATSRQAGPD